MRSHSHQKRKFFFFCGKWKTYFSDWEDLGRISCAVLEEGQGTFLSFFFTLFFTTYFFTLFFVFFSFEYLVEMSSHSHQNGQISIVLENGRHMSLIEQVWGPRQEIFCSFRGLSAKSDISPWNWKYQNTLSKPYENKSKELLSEIVMVALKGWNLGNLSPIL